MALRKVLVSFRKLLELLLRRHQLAVDEVHLLGRILFVQRLSSLSRCWSLASDVVQVILLVCLELGVFELPRLDRLVHVICSRREGTDLGSVLGRSVVFIVLSDLVEVILVQLPDEGSKVAVLEVLWQDQLGEFLIL